MMNNYNYYKSEATGQVYKVDFVPKFSGWTPTTESEYVEWCKAHGIKP